MNKFGISEKSFKLIVDYFKNQNNIEEVIIFGSRAIGNYKKGSDIDIAIKGKGARKISSVSIAAYLNENLPIPYKIDVVDYNFLNHPDLKHHIDTVGIPMGVY